MGWFGPRGLATVVFSLLLLEEAVPGGDLIASVAVIGVVISVYAHGLTAAPLTGVYARWYATRTTTAPALPMESVSVHEHPVRSADRG